jgi:hypothetical protein
LFKLRPLQRRVQHCDWLQSMGRPRSARAAGRVIMFAMLVGPPASLPVAAALRDVEQLSPAAAGDLLLRDRPHGPIISMSRVARMTMDPPGVSEFELFEAPRRMPGGCARRRWKASFVSGRSGGPDDAAFRDAYAAEEIALAGRAGCPGSNYVYVNPGLDIEPALRMLRTFQQVTSGALRVSFTCKTLEHDPLCKSRASIQAAVARTPPWVVSLIGDSAEFWLKTPGGTVTKVRFEGDCPRHVSVAREIPPPF